MDVIRSIRTRPQNTRPEPGPENTRPDGRIRLIAKVLRDVAGAGRFEDYASLKDAFRRRLLQLRLRCSQAEFDDAISVVQYGTPLVSSPPVEDERRPGPPTEPFIGRQEATALYTSLLLASGLERGMKSMPGAQRSADEQREHAAKIESQVRAVRRAGERKKRRPIRERLEEIFGARI